MGVGVAPLGVVWHKTITVRLLPNLILTSICSVTLKGPNSLLLNEYQINHFLELANLLTVLNHAICKVQTRSKLKHSNPHQSFTLDAPMGDTCLMF